MTTATSRTLDLMTHDQRSLLTAILADPEDGRLLQAGRQVGAGIGPHDHGISHAARSVAQRQSELTPPPPPAKGAHFWKKWREMR